LAPVVIVPFSVFPPFARVKEPTIVELVAEVTVIVHPLKKVAVENPDSAMVEPTRFVG